MFNIVLFEPEIPPNTGNIMRMAANCGCQLHLIKPLGFELDNKKLRRAGLDYREFTRVTLHENWNAFNALFIASESNSPIYDRSRLFPISTKGKHFYAEINFTKNDFFLFGPETRGLPKEVLATFRPQSILRIPMLPENRSLNLSNAATAVVYEAWRQHGFAGAI